MDALDEETKDSILRNIGELFPNVSDLSFFRQIFENENWDLEKSIDTIKSLLEYVGEAAVDNEPPPNNNTRTVNPAPEPKPRTAPGPTPTNTLPSSGLSGSSSGCTSRNPDPRTWNMLFSPSVAKTGTAPKSTTSEKKSPASKAERREKLLRAYKDGLKLKNPVLRLKTFALEGIKVMIIMRGCPGSGKTYLVQHLANSLSVEQSKALGWSVAHQVDHHVFSADDFWITPTGKYVFNSEYIEYAHLWNQKLVRQAASEGRSPIFVDNTHTRLWEMQNVATIAVEFGYIIEIIDTKEVNKKWAFNVNELVRRNVHGVHYDAIKRMVERYELDVQPKHLFKAYSLKYQPNMTPPQRCLVTFSTPPSKNQLKIFSSRFHFVPINDILALKTEPGTGNPAKTKNGPQKERVSLANPNYLVGLGASQLKRVGLADPNYPIGVGAAESMTPKDTLRHKTPAMGKGELLSNQRHHSDPFHWTAPTGDSFGSTASGACQGAQNTCFSRPQFWQNSDAQPLISPAEYIWSSPYAPGNAVSTPVSMDLVSLLDENPTSDQLLPPTKNSNSVDTIHGAPSKSDSGSDLLMSFDELSLGTSETSSGSKVSPLGCPESNKNSDSSPIKDTPIEDEIGDSDSSCETLPMPSRSCDEFGQEVTSEYVLVRSDGHLMFQYSHERMPVSLREFQATSKLEQLKKKLAKSVDRNDSVSSTVNKWKKRLLKTHTDVSGCSDTLLPNGSRASSEPERSNSQSKAFLGSIGQSAEAASSGGERDQSGSSSEPHGDSPEIEVIELSGINSRDFFERVWEKFESDGAAESKVSTGETSTAAAFIAPIVESTWTDKEVEPVPFSRSESPKAQRTRIERTLTKKCDKGTDANYFEIVSKANTEALSSDAILFGNAGSFRSSPSPPKQDGIKAVATHEKSSMTKFDESADEIDSGVEVLAKMFPGVSLDCLVDLFEKCQRNLHWTANLLMDSGVEVSEHFNAEVVPRKEPEPPSLTLQTVEASQPNSNESLTAPPILKKMKKNRLKLTEEHLDLVKEFESNFILSEDHYSDTLKKVRETKFGRPAEAEPVEEPSTSRDSTPPNDPESSSSELLDDDEGDMNLVVSNHLMEQLQNKFGPIPNLYGDELVVKLPVSLARQIYSYTLESICQQVEEEQNIFDLIVKQDEAFARKLQEESDGSRGAVSFQEIMDYEMALRAHEREQGQASAASSETFASRLSQQLLAERFPNMDPATLQNVLDVTNHSLHEATSLLASAGHVPVDAGAQQETAKKSENEPSYTMSRKESIEQANAYHEVAAKLNDMRQLYFQKAKESYNSGNHAVALFYSELFNWYSDQIKASNAKAAKAMLRGNEGATTLDLHYLHVSEAVTILDLFLDESIRQLNARKTEIFIITGRGLHSSSGKSKLKPAIKQRLKQRGLLYEEVNPGMLKTVITKSSTVSYTLNGVQC